MIEEQKERVYFENYYAEDDSVAPEKESCFTVIIALFINLLSFIELLNY
jgi:hypothetical protein